MKRFIITTMFCTVAVFGNGQECDLMQFFIKSKNRSYIYEKTSEVFYFKETDIKEKLALHFSNNVADSLLLTIKAENKIAGKLYTLKTCDSTKFINDHLVEQFKEYNTRPEVTKSVESASMRVHIFYFSAPIYYKEYVIITVTDFVSYSNAVTSTYLLETKTNGWNIIEILCQAVS